MVKLSQFVSRNIMTRDKMSQPLVAWCLGLVACSFFYFLEKDQPTPDCLCSSGGGASTDPRSSLPVLKQG